MDGTKTRTSGGNTLSSRRTAPLKPKPGLSGPPANNDYFGARYYSSTMGRFLTPDWAATPVPIPYAVMGNPQTLNLYSYVENNPITGTDPDGHGSLPSSYIGDAAGWYECLIHTCSGSKPTQKDKTTPAQKKSE